MITNHGKTITDLALEAVDPLTGTPITEADVLTPAVGGPPPGIAINGGAVNGLGLPQYAGAVGHVGGVAGQVEVDALSYGTDLLIAPNIGPYTK